MPQQTVERGKSRLSASRGGLHGHQPRCIQRDGKAQVLPTTVNRVSIVDASRGGHAHTNQRPQQLVVDSKPLGLVLRRVHELRHITIESTAQIPTVYLA